MLFLALTVFQACLAWAEEVASSLPGADFTDLKISETRRVTEVIDPLTIRLDSDKLYSLTGLEIPDFNPYNPGSISETTLKVLKDMLPEKEVNAWQQTKKKDAGLTNRMGHALAQLEVKESGAWVQGTLLRLGLARVKTERRNPEMAAAMLALEAQARGEKLGLWALPDYQVIAPDQALGKKGSFQVVEGIVVSTAMKQNRVYLNFGNNWKDDFTVTIPPEFRTNFFKNKLDPLKLGGKRIRVRGWVEEFNGPFIEIDHPERIEVLGE